MKKLFAILTIASFLTACNNKTESTTTTSDSISTESPLNDAVNTADSASHMMHDSTIHIPDSMPK